MFQASPPFTVSFCFFEDAGEAPSGLAQFGQDLRSVKLRSELRAGCHVLPFQWPAHGGEYISTRIKLTDTRVEAIQGGSKAGGKAQKMELHASGEGQARRQM